MPDDEPPATDRHLPALPDTPAEQEAHRPSTDETWWDDDLPLDEPSSPWASVRERLDRWRTRWLPLPDEVIHEHLELDEYVVHSDRPAFGEFVYRNLQWIGLMTAAVGSALWITWLVGFYQVVWLYCFLVANVALLIMASKRIRTRYRSYVITNHRLIRATGVIRRQVHSLPWHRVLGLGYEQSRAGGSIGFATISIASASDRSGLRHINGLLDPATFYEQMVAMTERSRRLGQPTRPPSRPHPRRSLLGHLRSARRDIPGRLPPPSER